MTPYVIVLGAAVWPGGVASPTLARRASHAAALALQTGGTVITTGGLGKHPPTEAAVAAAICAGLGVPGDRILTEVLSTTTYENLANAKRLMPAGATAVIVTDYYHLPRARLTAWALGINATGSFPRGGLRQTPLHRHLRQVLREALALPVYAVRLALGRHPKD
ncbi:YdcF family protein [Rhodobacter ferrooxidans]|uniref:DUF218 domain-containing protein n=1 Tax=Rhodobacter ferrooxidans TaxID=371731 RepID=C8RZU3_9RHOB|nr:YdcF family protein [Rhodobacter sp. SW2]EEW25890.1 protein of unknown function DUF218 [Rhodobacter sp. SW2]